MNILVTGGAGYIGSHVCKLLKEESYNPITVDSLISGSESLVRYGDLIKSDAGNYNKMTEILSKYKPTAIMHFASHKSVSESRLDPIKYYDNNVAVTISILRAMKDCGVKHLIFSSSAAIFGTPENNETTVKIDSKKNPINPYGMSKLMVENILDDCDNAYGIKFTSLRYFNACGSDPNLEIGEMSNISPNIIPAIFSAASGKTKFFTIFGDDYDTYDGTCIRDYIHVCDLADAHIKALKKQLLTNKSAKVNLGNEKGFSVKNIIEITKKITKLDFDVKVGPRRIGDPAILISDSKFAQAYLNWKPKFTNVEDAINHSWNWYKKSNYDKINEQKNTR
jgi:UDP-glucose 4-epimerase